MVCLIVEQLSPTVLVYECVNPRRTIEDNCSTLMVEQLSPTVPRNAIVKLCSVTLRIFLSVAAVGCLAIATASPQETRRLDSRDLLKYHPSDGALAAVDSIEKWQRRREEILRGMQSVIGTASVEWTRGPLEQRLVEEVDCGAYVRQLITYRSDAGAPTPAYLCIPRDALAGERQVPAVLCLHPTDHEIGHQVVVGLGGKPERAYAAELAERGYVTLAPAYPLLANYWPNLEQFGYGSGTLKGIWDNVRGLELLAALPYVDTRRGFGAIGHSLGGHNAIFTAALDERISVVVSSCGFDSFRDYYGGDVRNWYYGKGWCQLRYMPRMSDYRGKLEEIPFDFPELLGALAPRAVFVNAPVHDDNFGWQSVDTCVAAARPVYALYGADSKLQVVHPECGHDFPDEIREKAYAVIDGVLRAESK